MAKGRVTGPGGRRRTARVVFLWEAGEGGQRKCSTVGRGDGYPVLGNRRMPLSWYALNVGSHGT